MTLAPSALAGLRGWVVGGIPDTSLLGSPPELWRADLTDQADLADRFVVAILSSSWLGSPQKTLHADLADAWRERSPQGRDADQLDERS